MSNMKPGSSTENLDRNKLNTKVDVTIFKSNHLWLLFIYLECPLLDKMCKKSHLNIIRKRGEISFRLRLTCSTNAHKLQNTVIKKREKFFSGVYWRLAPTNRNCSGRRAAIAAKWLKVAGNGLGRVSQTVNVGFHPVAAGMEFLYRNGSICSCIDALCL